MSRSHQLAIVLLGVAALVVLVGVGATVADPTVGDISTFVDDSEENRTAPTSSPNFDTSERLMLPPDNLTTGLGDARVDPGRSTSVGFTRASAEYQKHLLDARANEVGTSEEELEVLRAELAVLEDDLEALHRSEREAHEAFATGEIDAAQFLAELAENHERSLVLQDRFTHMNEVLRGITLPIVQDEVTGLRGRVLQFTLEADTLQGPLRAESFAGVLGGSSEHSSMVWASPQGHVIATIDNGVFTRESYVAPNRDRESSTSFRDAVDGRERAGALYPWTFDDSVGTQDLLRGDIYWASIEHSHGTTTMFVDGETELPFRDIHELDLFTLPTDTVVATNQAGYDLQVDAIYAGGPARIQLTDGGEPTANATVLVDGSDVTMTNEAGEAWIVTPGETFHLEIVTDEAEIEIEVEVPVGTLTEE